MRNKKDYTIKVITYVYVTAEDEEEAEEMFEKHYANLARDAEYIEIEEC